MTPEDLTLREALDTDHDAILNITKGEDFYNGKDYLPDVLAEWLKEGMDKTSNRRNLVFLLPADSSCSNQGNEVVGFITLYLQNGGTVVAYSARRIIKRIRGKRSFSTSITQNS